MLFEMEVNKGQAVQDQTTHGESNATHDRLMPKPDTTDQPAAKPLCLGKTQETGVKND